MPAYCTMARARVTLPASERIRALLVRATDPEDAFYGGGLHLTPPGVQKAAALTDEVAREWGAMAVVTDSLLCPWTPAGFQGGAVPSPGKQWQRPSSRSPVRLLLAPPARGGSSRDVHVPCQVRPLRRPGTGRR